MDNRPDSVKWQTEHSSQFNKQSKNRTYSGYRVQKSPEAKANRRREHFKEEDPCRQKVTHELTPFMDNRHDSSKWQTENCLYLKHGPGDGATH